MLEDLTGPRVHVSCMSLEELVLLSKYHEDTPVIKKKKRTKKKNKKERKTTANNESIMHETQTSLTLEKGKGLLFYDLYYH